MERLGQVLDLERFVSLLAMEVMTCHGRLRAQSEQLRCSMTSRATGWCSCRTASTRCSGVPVRPAQLDPSADAGPGRTGAPGKPDGREAYLQRIAKPAVAGLPRGEADESRPGVVPPNSPHAGRLWPDWRGSTTRRSPIFCQRIGGACRSISDQLASPPEPPWAEIKLMCQLGTASGEAGFARILGR